MRKVIVSVLVSAGVVVGAALPSSAAVGPARTFPIRSAGVMQPDFPNNDSCPSNYSCYYDGYDGVTKIWTAPSAGCFTLANSLHDRISSVINLGHGTVHLYSWNGTNAYVRTADIPVDYNYGYNLSGSANNTTDKVCID